MLQKRIVAADCDELVALEELEEPILEKRATMMLAIKLLKCRTLPK